jgi:hydroxymethylpyrimidine pyrophosphatase-like HAD family hydrolase
MKKFVFDIDGTICEEGPAQERIFSQPKNETIEFINKLYSQGHMIIIYTARSWDQYKITTHWLKNNNINYDYWIDDRCVNVDDLIDFKNNF